MYYNLLIKGVPEPGIYTGFKFGVWKKQWKKAIITPKNTVALDEVYVYLVRYLGGKHIIGSLA